MMDPRSAMKRIGQILIEAGFVTGAALERALLKQKEIPRRLCSLLIAHDLINLDVASRVLGEQLGAPAVLQKHLDGRDRTLAELFPAELARSWCMLPIGRSGRGALIVCARDPSPAALAAATAIVPGDIVLAVAPASAVETLIAEVYGTPKEDFDVDLTTGPIYSLDLEPMPPAGTRAPSHGGFGNLELVELDDQGVSRDLDQSGTIQVGPSRQVPLPPSSAGIKLPPVDPPEPVVARTITPPRTLTPPAVIVSAPPPPVVVEPPSVPRTSAKPITIPPASMAAAKLPRAPGVIARKPPTMPPPVGTTTRSAPSVRPANRMPTAPPIELAPPEFDPKAIAAGTEPPRRKVPTIQPWAIAEALAAVKAATTAEATAAAAMRFAAGRWRAALLLEVRDKIAAGEIGHGQLLDEDAVAALALPLGAPSIVAQAIDTGALATEPPESPVQDRLDRLLGLPRFPAAIPIVVGAKRAFVLAVGDAITGDTDTAMQDLEKIAAALGTAYTKLSR